MTKNFTPDKNRRPQRVASDTAHSWARNLRLHNPYAKLVLSMMTLYVQGEGVVFVGVPTLAEDCELAQETVRRRLAWLEQVGAVTRLPQWIDEAGRRNSEGRGRRTTDEIRLMLDTAPELIEARAAGDVEAEQRIAAGSERDGALDPLPHGGSDPLRQTGSDDEKPYDGEPQAQHFLDEKNLGWDSISPLATPSVRTGPDSLEPEPEDIPPNPPSGGGSPSGEMEQESEWPHAERWAKVERLWGEPILHQSICRQLWAAFTDGERERFYDVIRGYNAWRDKQKRPPNRCNLQKLMRERDAWPGYEAMAPAKPKPAPLPPAEHWIDEGSAEFRALTLACVIARRTLPIAIHRDEKPKAIRLIGDIPAGSESLAALLKLDPNGEPVADGWLIVLKGTKQFFSWAERLREWLGRAPPDYRIFVDKNGRPVAKKEDADTFQVGEHVLPKCRDGYLVPSEWPPPKATSKPRPDALATEEDLNEFAKTG